MEAEKNIRSSINELEAFKESFVWLDMLDELDGLLRVTNAEYDTVGEPYNKDGISHVPGTAETLIHLGELKGHKKALNYFKQIPDILIGLLEDNKDDFKREPAE